MAQLVKIESSKHILIFNIDAVKSIYIDGDNDVHIDFTDETTNYLYCDSKEDAKSAIDNMVLLNISNEHKTINV